MRLDGAAAAAAAAAVVLLLSSCGVTATAAALPGLRHNLGADFASKDMQVSSFAAATAEEVLLGRNEALHFQAIGDWGRQGMWNQSELAGVMARAARNAPLAFVISTGDNFYPSGLTSVDDPNFEQSFSGVYRQPELQVPWYAVLGNHDYGDGIAPGDPPPACAEREPPWRCSAGPLTQLSTDLAARDPRWTARRSRVLSLGDGAVDVFMYDTTPFVQYYYDREWADNPGGIAEQSWRANLVELEAELAASTASWKIVVGHHPVRSNGGEHGDTPELREWVEPLLEKHGVQLYLAGHDHDVEHIKGRQHRTHHIVSGGGSKTRPDFRGDADAVFQHGLQGFVAITVRRHGLEASFWGLGGRQQPMYTATIPRRGEESAATAGRTSASEEEVLFAESEGSGRWQ